MNVTASRIVFTGGIVSMVAAVVVGLVLKPWAVLLAFAGLLLATMVAVLWTEACLVFPAKRKRK